MAHDNSHQTGCVICGKALVYSQETSERACAICGAIFRSNAACEAGHFVCDSCHSGSANDLIQRVCLTSRSTAPIELAARIMASPLVKMHGPEHHFLVPAVLLSAYCNAVGVSDEEKSRLIETARRRAEDVKGGFCGFLGSCGAGMGTGMFISLITGATPYSRSEWGLANRMTAESLQSISEHGGPRCCKRDTFLALLSAASFLRARMSVDLEAGNPRCVWSARNKECRSEECPFYEAKEAGRSGS